MKIVYRDTLGIVAMEVNRDGIDFCDGFAYFTADWGEDYKIPMGAICRIICA
ncbi:MAG: hypothetical protein IJH71_08090 [Eubacterium sp.]|nr:hypothetical protein [Eubacterium sp.]